MLIMGNQDHIWHKNPKSPADMPLFEELIRAYSRYPEKIKRIADLVDDLSNTEEGKKVLPDEFKRLWKAFQKAKRK